MNKSIKNIFAITVLALTCSPALRCEDTQAQTVSTSKLQSAINYVKNIRTPLTPQETLAQYIAHADVDGFKNTYNSFQEWTPSDRTATLQTLAVTAQEVKQQLQAELESMGNKVKKSTIAKGIVQTVSGLFLTSTAAITCSSAYKYFFKNYNENKFNTIEKFSALPYISIPAFLSTYCGMCANEYCKIKHPKPYLSIKTNKKIVYCLTATFLLTGAIFGAYTAKTGIQNCKNGWNYKAYVEQQIANIDEINEFIQAQQKLS